MFIDLHRNSPHGAGGHHDGQRIWILPFCAQTAPWPLGRDLLPHWLSGSWRGRRRGAGCQGAEPRGHSRSISNKQLPPRCGLKVFGLKAYEVLGC